MDPDVDISVLEAILDIVYKGEGRVPDNPDEFLSVVNMLQLDSLFLKDFISDDGDSENNSDVIRYDLKLSESRIEIKDSQDEANSGFSGVFLTSNQVDIEELVRTNVISESVDIDMFEDDNFAIKASEIPEWCYSAMLNQNADENTEVVHRKQVIKLTEKTDVTCHDKYIEDKTYEPNERDDDIIEVSNGTDSLKRHDKKSKLSNQEKTDQDYHHELLLDSPTNNKEKASPTLHCPFPLCSYSHKSAMDVQTHIAARHYRGQVQTQFPDFLEKTCRECEATFSVSSNYYHHMAAHMGLKFMTDSEVRNLARELEVSLHGGDDDISVELDLMTY